MNLVTADDNYETISNEFSREGNDVRSETPAVNVGGVIIGGLAPIVVQSMTNTDTADIEATVKQIIDLKIAGSEIVRVTVDRKESAKAIPEIYNLLIQKDCEIPIVGDFHYIGHKLLTEYPDCANLLANYRINPGNVGFGKKRDSQFSSMIETAVKYEKPVRIGVNWGSLDQELVAELMDINSKSANPKSSEEVTQNALISSAISSAERAEEIGLGKNKIIL